MGGGEDLTACNFFPANSAGAKKREKKQVTPLPTQQAPRRSQRGQKNEANFFVLAPDQCKGNKVGRTAEEGLCVRFHKKGINKPPNTTWFGGKFRQADGGGSGATIREGWNRAFLSDSGGGVSQPPGWKKAAGCLFSTYLAHQLLAGLDPWGGGLP